jgi:hypothetical protein
MTKAELLEALKDVPEETVIYVEIRLTEMVLWSPAGTAVVFEKDEMDPNAPQSAFIAGHPGIVKIEPVRGVICGM